jgi:hypothetical protein
MPPPIPLYTYSIVVSKLQITTAGVLDNSLEGGEGSGERIEQIDRQLVGFIVQLWCSGKHSSKQDQFYAPYK